MVGSPYDVTALAWTVVEEPDAVVCDARTRWTTAATRGGRPVRIERTKAAGMWPLLWAPDGALVLVGGPPACDEAPKAAWVLRDGEAAEVWAAAHSIAVRPGAG